MLLRSVSFLSIDRLMEVAPVRLPLPRSRPILPRAGPISVAVARTSGSSRLRSRTCGRRLTAGIDVVVVDGAASADLAPVQITWQIAVGALAGITPFVVAGIEFSKRIIAQRKCGVCGGSGLILLKDKSYSRCPGCGAISNRLLFGDIKAAAEVLQKGSAEVTHVLSLLSSASISFFSGWRPDISILTQKIKEVYAAADGSWRKSLTPGKLLYSLEHAGPELKLVRMGVPLRDTEDEDLLDYLDVCLDFIDQGRKEGSVLVHCFAGISQSAAVITAYLMKTEQKSLEDALESLREVCDVVCPNDGFLDQLSLFEEMGFKVDTESPIYKRFCLKVLGHSYKQGEKLDSPVFGADPGLPADSIPSEGIKGDEHTAYRCKKCRRVVALQENVVSHVPGEEALNSSQGLVLVALMLSVELKFKQQSGC